MIRIQPQRNSYRPGEIIHAELLLDELIEPCEIDVRLIWYTQGKGTRAFEVVSNQKISTQRGPGSVSFQMIAPDWPHSFTGELLSLHWALEAEGPNALKSLPVNLIISPTLSELQLPYDNPVPSSRHGLWIQPVRT